MGCIYKITNTVSGKAYIGKSIDDSAYLRIYKHFNGQGSRLISAAIRKYGKDALTYEILYDGIIPEILDSFEVESIKIHNTITPHGYNLTSGGEGGEHSLETRQKISEANRRRTHSEKTRRKMSKAQRGRCHSEEACQKMSEAHKGKIIPIEQRLKISETLKGKKLSPEHCQNLSKPRKSRNPHKENVYNYFLSLSSTFTIQEKRRCLLKKYKDVVRPKTIWRWVKSWTT